MSRYRILVVLILVILVLTACGTENQESSAQAASDGGLREMSLSMKLMLGTFKLDETDYPIDAVQAGQLLPLWKAIRSLTESETTAREEVDAVVNQIEDNMTQVQLQAIEDMQLSFQDMGELAEELGLDFDGRFGNMSPEMQQTMQAARASGQGNPFGGQGFPGGGPGGGGPGGGFDGGLSPEARETAIAERGGSRGGFGLGVNPEMLEAVIEFLEGKTQ